jgi:hypothetical protein
MKSKEGNTFCVCVCVFGRIKTSIIPSLLANIAKSLYLHMVGKGGILYRCVSSRGHGREEAYIHRLINKKDTKA